MDFVDYSPLANTSNFPSVSASASSPKTLLHAHSDIVYLNVGSGWVPMAQESSHSVYSGYSTLPASTQANVLSNLTSTTNPALHPAKSGRVVDIAVRGR